MEKGDGKIFNGKTYKLCKMVESEEKPLVMAFTNNAVENVKKKFQRVREICFTINSSFFEHNGRSIKDLSGKTLFIE